MPDETQRSNPSIYVDVASAANEHTLVVIPTGRVMRFSCVDMMDVVSEVVAIKSQFPSAKIKINKRGLGALVIDLLRNIGYDVTETD